MCLLSFQNNVLKWILSSIEDQSNIPRGSLKNENFEIIGM